MTARPPIDPDSGWPGVFDRFLALAAQRRKEGHDDFREQASTLGEMLCRCMNDNGETAADIVHVNARMREPENYDYAEKVLVNPPMKSLPWEESFYAGHGAAFSMPDLPSHPPFLFHLWTRNFFYGMHEYDGAVCVVSVPLHPKAAAFYTEDNPLGYIGDKY